MTLCTPTMTIVFWIAIAATSIAGFWFIWKRYTLEKEHTLWLEEAEKSLKEHYQRKDAETEFIRGEYEKARNGYLGMMKEIQSDQIPDPN